MIQQARQCNEAKSTRSFIYKTHNGNIPHEQELCAYIHDCRSTRHKICTPDTQVSCVYICKIQMGQHLNQRKRNSRKWTSMFTMNEAVYDWWWWYCLRLKMIFAMDDAIYDCRWCLWMTRMFTSSKWVIILMSILRVLAGIHARRIALVQTHLSQSMWRSGRWMMTSKLFLKLLHKSRSVYRHAWSWGRCPGPGSPACLNLEETMGNRIWKKWITTHAWTWITRSKSTLQVKGPCTLLLSCIKLGKKSAWWQSESCFENSTVNRNPCLTVSIVNRNRCFAIGTARKEKSIEITSNPSQVWITPETVSAINWTSRHNDFFPISRWGFPPPKRISTSSLKWVLCSKILAWKSVLSNRTCLQNKVCASEPML